jgi:hypothetical protein
MKPKASIFQYDNPKSLYGIRLPRELPRDWKIPRHDWEECPGTLHETYGSWEAAIKAAEWWGFRVDKCKCGHPRPPHEHYRGGTDCGICPSCHRYRGVRGAWWQLWVPVIAIIAGMIAIFAGVAAMMAMGFNPYT